MDIWNRAWIFTTTVVRNICVYGQIGSGKSTRVQKISQKNVYHLSQPIISIEMDAVVGFWHSQPRVQKIIRDTMRINTVLWKQNTPLKSVLFHSPPLQQKKAWNCLEKIFHPLITSFIQQSITQTQKQKGTLIWDMALPFLFPQGANSKLLHIPSKGVYTTLFLLKKNRGLSYKKTLFFMQRQAVQFQNYSR